MPHFPLIAVKGIKREKNRLQRVEKRKAQLVIDMNQRKIGEAKRKEIARLKQRGRSLIDTVIWTRMPVSVVAPIYNSL